MVLILGLKNVLTDFVHTENCWNEVYRTHKIFNYLFEFSKLSSPEKRWIVWLIFQLLPPRKLNMLHWLHQGNPYRWQMPVFANCLTCVNSLSNSSQFHQVYSYVVFLRSRIYFKHFLERLVCSWSSFRSWHSEQGQSGRMLATCLNILLCSVQLDSNIQNMSVRREGQSFRNYISHILEVIFAVSSLPTL